MRLSEREVHVWTLRIPSAREALATLERTLSADERERAARYRFEHLRESFVITRGTLRCLLAGYLPLGPAAIQFRYCEKGKPSVDGIDFSTTHSGEMAAFAFAEGCPVGIDVEQIRAVHEMAAIAERFLGSKECDPAEFFRNWTRREAYVKAIGEGLSALQQPLPTSGWTLHDLSLAPGYAAALAYRDRERPVILRPFPEPPASSPGHMPRCT